jgi:predicted aspartyl protease
MTVFLRGIITPDYVPLVNRFYVVTGAQDIPVAAILDTGFTGSVILPRKLLPLGQFELSGITRYELANGDVISEELYKTTIRLGKLKIPVVASFTDSDLGLIGMALIDGKRAIFDLRRYTFRVIE